MKSIFEDTLKVSEIKTGQFDRVKRIVGESDIYDLKIELDVNTEIYPMETDKVYYFSLAKTINDGSIDVKDLYNPEDTTEDAFFDKYEYVTYGKIFECRPIDKERMLVYISYGGLLMSIEGSITYLRELKYDSRLYLMLKKA